MGRPFQVQWSPEDTAEALKVACEREPEQRTRLHGLWLLRRGWSLQDVAEALGVHYRSVQRWVAWYRQGGVAEVCAHRAGGHGQPACLTPEQEARLVEEAAGGRFATAEEARQWVAEEFGVVYRPAGMYGVLYRLGCWPKVPRPVHVKADRAAQEAWKRGVA